jgi:molybdopterin/thiamine biosynthesis adenylyltransferase
MLNFDYNLAFSRNLGWVTKKEQSLLKNKRIAIAGMGGAGGEYLITMTRLGIGKFNISDFDEFEVGNFNRQAGAFMHTVNKKKVKSMETQALSVNPNLDINIFDKGINENNLSEFLKDVDLYLDGLDIYAPEIRRKIFAYCAEHNIPAITAAPIGMGTAVLTFMPGKMTFEEFFGMKGKTKLEQTIRLIAEISTLRDHLKYIADPDAVDFENQKTPSTIMGIKLCAGVIGTIALKILLQRGKVLVAPRGLHFDAYTNTFKKTWMPWGHKNPIQQLIIALVKKKLVPSKKGKITTQYTYTNLIII